MEIISASVIDSILRGTVTNKSPFDGVILVANYNIALTRNNKEYVQGTLKSGKNIPFKCWEGSEAFKKLKVEEYTNTPCYVNGYVDNYNGIISIIVTDVKAVEGYTPDQFLEVRYNTESYYSALVNLLQNNVSEKAMTIFSSIFTPELVELFKNEFAASSHHDNCKGGLLAHTYKCLSLCSWVCATYSTLLCEPTEEGLEVSQDRKDLIFLGTVLHDVGKVREMNFGVYTRCSKVTHRYLGVEFLSPLKDKIIELYSEDWYYDLVSIMLQHHGEWGDPCKTIVAYVIHKVDLFESCLTDLTQVMNERMVDSSVGFKISVDGSWLAI